MQRPLIGGFMNPTKFTLVPSNARPKLRVVILETPYDTWFEKGAQELFSKMIGLKFTGYLKEHPYGSLPVDTSDFVANHLLVCDERNGELIPLMGYKTITLSRCRTHQLTFPALSLLSSSNAPTEHKQAVLEILNRCEANKIEVSYDSSWTIHPDARADRELTLELRDILTSVVSRYHREYEIPEILGLGVVKLKTAKLFATWGLEPMSVNGEPLPTFTLSSLQGAEVLLVHGKPFSETALALTERYANFWEERVTISSPAIAAQKRKAA